MPVSIERAAWEYLSGKAEQRAGELFELVSEVLKRDIEINEALNKWCRQLSRSSRPVSDGGASLGFGRARPLGFAFVVELLALG